MSEAPQFPPLFEGLALSGSADPFAKAKTQAIMGCDAGLVVYNLAADQLRAVARTRSRAHSAPPPR